MKYFNCRPMSLFLPIFAQSFWKTYLILFSAIFIIAIYLPNVNQTSCQVTLVSQLLSIVHEIQSSFDYNPPTDVRAIFLYIWKALDEVWHQGLLSKSKLYGVEGDLSEIYFDKKTKSDTWWSVLILENYFFWRTTRFIFRTAPVSYLYKWLSKWS